MVVMLFRRGFLFGLALALLAPVVPASSAPDGSGPRPCPSVAHVAGVGDACLHPNGLWEVFAPDGRSLGFTHGPDPDRPQPPVVEVAGGPTIDIECVDGTYGDGSYAFQVFYARAYDDTDQFASRVTPIRNQIAASAKTLALSAAASGGGGTVLRVRCSGGEVAVQSAVLATSRSAATFSTIVQDLRNLGYTSARDKHLVFYDDTNVACPNCAGQGHLYPDDDAELNNNSNGLYSTYALTYGPTRDWAMTHEMGHTIGAVQDSAPNTTGAGHCIDGLDVMCYNDGGPRGNQYSSSVCSQEIFDCNHNDYFNADPAPGSYLATHWNLAGPYNRYVRLTGGPDLDLLVPLSGYIYEGCTQLSRIPVDTSFVPPLHVDVVYLTTACVKLAATDADGIGEVKLLYDGQHIATRTAPGPDGTYTFTFYTYGPFPQVPVEVIAKDSLGNPSRATARVWTACCPPVPGRDQY